MKHLRKFVSLLLTFVMVLAMTATAFADTTGSINVKNATVGKDYSIYKIFDATYIADSEGNLTNAAYSINTSDAWYDLVRAKTDLFTLTSWADDPTTFNVTVAEGGDVLGWLKTLVVADLPSATATQEDVKDTTVTFDNVEFGYYYILSSLGTTITVDNVNSNVTVIDKNQAPGWDPENPTDPDDSGENGKFVASDANDDNKADDYAKTSTDTIGDTVYFKINAYVPAYAGADQVHTYTFTDTLDAGFGYTEESIKLALTSSDGEFDLSTNDYSVSVANQVITIQLFAGAIENYPTDAHVSITYTATVDTDAVYDNVNKVSMDWTLIDPENPDTPKEPDPDDPEQPDEPEDSKTDTYVYGFNIQKYKENVADENELTGAKFKLYDAETEGNEIPVVRNNNGTYRVAVSGEEGVEIEAGLAEIFGLEAGTYYLEETVAPAGYNKLTARRELTVGPDSTEVETSNDETTVTFSTENIVNNAGSLLPETGGMGTTIFYLVGGILVLGAVVVMVSRKRMSIED